MNDKVIILFLAANPMDTTRLRSDEEVRSIDHALRQSEFRDRFNLQKHGAVRVSDLQSLLLRYEPDIVHFSGHGSDIGEIVLEDDDGKSTSVSTDALSKLFSLFKDKVKCVVLSACFSELQAKSIAQHVDAVIGMPAQISDTVAVKFASSFYEALGFGKDIEMAFELGCLRVDLHKLVRGNRPQLIALNSIPSNIVFTKSEQIQISENQQPIGKVNTSSDSFLNKSRRIQVSSSDLIITTEWSRYPMTDKRACLLINLIHSEPPIFFNISCVTHLSSNNNNIIEQYVKERLSRPFYKRGDKISISSATDKLAPTVNTAIESLRNFMDREQVIPIILLLIDSDVLDEDEVLLEVERAGGLNIPIRVIGIGDNWSVEFADMIAQKSGGVSGYCETIDKVYREMEYLRQVAMGPKLSISNVKLIVKIESNINLEYVYKMSPQISKCEFHRSGNSYVIPISTIAFGVDIYRHTFLTSLENASQNPGESIVGTIEVVYTHSQSNLKQLTSCNFECDFYIDGKIQRVNPEIMHLVSKISLF